MLLGRLSIIRALKVEEDTDKTNTAVEIGIIDIFLPKLQRESVFLISQPSPTPPSRTPLKARDADDPISVNTLKHTKNTEIGYVTRLTTDGP